MSGTLRIIPAPPHVPSLTSSVKTHTAALGMEPGAVLRLDHGLGHRRGHRGTALVVVLALGDLADEAVVRRLRRGAGDVHLRAVDGNPGERSRSLVGRINSLVLEQLVGDPAQQLAFRAGREGSVGYVCATHRHRVLTSSRPRSRIVVFAFKPFPFTCATAGGPR